MTLCLPTLGTARFILVVAFVVIFNRYRKIAPSNWSFQPLGLSEYILCLFMQLS